MDSRGGEIGHPKTGALDTLRREDWTANNDPVEWIYAPIRCELFEEGH